MLISLFVSQDAHDALDEFLLTLGFHRHVDQLKVPQ